MLHYLLLIETQCHCNFHLCEKDVTVLIVWGPIEKMICAQKYSTKSYLCYHIIFYSPGKTKSKKEIYRKIEQISFSLAGNVK